MKKNKIIALIAGIACTATAFAQYQLASQATVRYTTISPNGDWLAGTNTESAAQMWNKRTNTYTSFNGIYTTNFINNDGVIAGSEESQAAIYIPSRNNWVRLSLPANVILSDACYVNATADTIAGYLYYDISGDNDLVVIPVQWVINWETNYVSGKMLAYNPIDMFGVTAQGSQPLSASNDGSRILGRNVDGLGQFALPMVWDRATDGSYAPRTFGLNLLFEHPELLPTYPESYEMPSVNNYLTAADSARYQALSDAYDDCIALDLGNCGTQPTYRDVLSADSALSYQRDSTRAASFTAQVEQWLDSVGNLWTGWRFDVYGMSISGNGKYIAMNVYYMDKTNTQSNEIAYLARINTETNELEINPNITGDILSMSVGNNGEMFYLDPYMEGVSCTKVLPTFTSQPQEITKWVKDTYGYNIADNLRFNDAANNMVDSLLTGQVLFAGENQTLLGYFRTAVNDPNKVPSTGMFSYVVNLDGYTSNKTVQDDNTLNVNIYPNPVQSEIRLSNSVEKAEILDLSGRKLGTAQATNSMAVGHLASGVYMLRLTQGGQTSIQKFVKE